MSLIETEATSTPHLEPDWIGQLVAELAAIERPSASPGEREAAEWLLAKLSDHGARGRIETSRAHGTYWWPLGIAAATGFAAGLLSLRGRSRLGALFAGLATAAAIDDMPPSGKRILRRALPQGERSQVVAELGPGDAERTVVVHAHHDAPRSGTLYSPAIPEVLFEHILPQGSIDSFDTSPPLMWPVVGGQIAVAVGSAIGSRALVRLGAVVAAGTAITLADVAAHETVQGANDNATGVAALVALARGFAETPTKTVRVLLVSTSEEATCDGMAEFARQHFPGLPRERTFFLSLDSLGSPQLLVLRGEGVLRMHEYPAPSLELLDGLADELDIELVPNLRTRNATDGCVPLAAGYQCASLSSCTHLKQISNYHWHTDVPENVNLETLRDGIRLSEAVVRRLDERWI